MINHQQSETATELSCCQVQEKRRPFPRAVAPVTPVPDETGFVLFHIGNAGENKVNETRLDKLVQTVAQDGFECSATQICKLS